MFAEVDSPELANRQKSLASAINDALPQTQCTRCGYPDCTAYANAIAREEAAINQCPPGGEEGVARLAALTGRKVEPLNPEHGLVGPRRLAVIDENWCIGCTLCFKACPTDAIVGANKTMHIVLDEFCTGCELCVPACPVDCISLTPVTGDSYGWQAWSAGQAQVARDRYVRRAGRLGLRLGEALPPPQQRTTHKLADTNVTTAIADTVDEAINCAATPVPDAGEDRKSAALAAILAKARARRSQTSS